MKILRKFFSIFLLLILLVAALSGASWARGDSLDSSAGAYNPIYSQPDYNYVDPGINMPRDSRVNDFNPAPVSDVGTSIVASSIDRFSNASGYANIDTGNIVSSSIFPSTSLGTNIADSTADILNSSTGNDPLYEAKNNALLADNSLVPKTIKNKRVSEGTP